MAQEELLSFLKQRGESIILLNFLKTQKRKKGLGYFGKLLRPDGKISTELTIGVTGAEYNWKETEIPLLVPTLTKDEVDSLLTSNEQSPEIEKKAREHASMRIKGGLSPFAQGEELGSAQPKTTEELFGTQEEDELLGFLKEQKKRPMFTVEELRGVTAKLLAKAQEKVKYKFTPGEIREQADKPKTWGAETWNMVGETMRELPAAQFFSKDFWTESGKTLVTQAVDYVKELSYSMASSMPMHKHDMTPEYRAWYEHNIERKVTPGITTEGEFGVVAAAEVATDFVLFIPKTLFKFADDPVEMMRDDPLSIATVILTVAGVKAMKKIKAKAVKNKGWVTTGDYVDPVLKSKMITEQLKKRLREVPSDIEIELGNVPLEVIKLKKGGKMPFYKHWWEGIKRDMATQKDLPDRWTKYKKNIGLRIPLRTFEQYPWLKRILYDEWRAGEFNAMLETAAFQNELKVWRKKLPRKSQERVGIHADYMQENGAAIMKFMEKAKPTLTALEMEYYRWGQKVFADFLPRLNRIRTLAGQKPIGKVTNYTTWIRNLSELESLGIDVLKASVEQIELHLNSIPLSMAKHRAKGFLRAGVELNYSLLLENYSRQATRNIHVSPAIIKARTLLEPFRLGKGNKITWDMFKETPRLATWLEEWTDAIAGQTKALPTGGLGRTVKIMKALNKNIAIAILSYNLRSALIQPTAFKLSYVTLGNKYLLEGFMKNLTKEGRAFADKNSQHLLARKKGMMDVQVAEIQQVQLGKKLGRTKQAIGQAGMFPLQWLDYQTARATWLGAYEMAVKKYGWKHQRAKVWADDVVVKTQASAQIGDIAPIQRTPLGKFATLFQTFVINEYDMLTHDVFGYKNPYMDIAAKQRAVGRFIISSVVVNAVYEGVFKLRSPYPAPIWSIKRSVEEGDSFLQATLGIVKELAEQYPIWGGTARWSTPYRIAFPAFAQKTIVDPYQMFERLVAKPSITKDQAEWMATMLGVPGTSQVSKYLRRRKRGQSHIEALLGVRAEIRRKRKLPSW